MNNEVTPISVIKLIILSCLAVGLVTGGIMFIMPQYNVWAAGLRGQAKLKQAEHEKLIMIETAKAEVEAARLRAKAIEAVGEAVQKYPEYRTQEFIGAFADAMQNGAIDQIVYIPTEAGIPILEVKR